MRAELTKLKLVASSWTYEFLVANAIARDTEEFLVQLLMIISDESRITPEIVDLMKLRYGELLAEIKNKEQQIPDASEVFLCYR